MKCRNLTIIGTSHIALQSMKKVRETIDDMKPDIIALELDKKRLYAITHKTKTKIGLRDIRRIGIKGFIFNLIGAWVEKKLGKMVGVRPGSEMITALKLAKKHKLKIALIDQDIEFTLAKLSKSITWREKFNFVADIFKGIFFGKRELKKIGIKSLDLTKVPEKKIIKKLTQNVKKRYPSIYNVLIYERNKILAANLAYIMKHYPESKILAIMGAGHEEEVMNLIKKNK
ncbi:TraB/GumN family protein [Candidatus Woesearchaeota archaeon]|nr:TraB/GumN family protein [Candidatus Woesearchaeota archaeon]